MAEKDEKKTGEDESKKGTLTLEQIEAIAKKAEKALNAKDDDDDTKKKGKGTGDDDDDDPGDDDDFQLDPKNIDTDKTLKYIDKLKDENAKRRIAGKKLDKKLNKTTEELQNAANALKAATEKLKEIDGKTEAEKAKERTDLENAQKTIDDLNAKINDLNKTVETNKTELEKTNRKVSVQNRETMITRLVDGKNVKFSSDFERDGLISSLTRMEDDGEFELDNDEAIYKVMEFIKTAQTKDNIQTPGPGPGNRKTSTPIGDEIQALMLVKNMNAEQKARLDELLELSGK